MPPTAGSSVPAQRVSLHSESNVPLSGHRFGVPLNSITLAVRGHCLYTLEDYKDAKAELARWNEQWDNYMGNNPDKYQADIKTSARKVREIGQYLKGAGVLELTEIEKLETELDGAFPNAQSKEVVEYNGKKYRRRFCPLEKSRSQKTVTEWGKSWEPVEE